MITFSRILCPIDFSETSTKALVDATAFATWYDAQLEVLHVAPAFDDAFIPTTTSVGAPGPTFYPRSREELLIEMHRTADAARAIVANSRLLAREGPTYEMIVNRARAQATDLLVIGTHGRSGFNRLFLGSVTEKVVRSVSCPALTVPPAAPASQTTPVALRRIVCAIDDSPSSRKALDYALDLARQADGRVIVLHVLEYMNANEPPEPSPSDPCYEAVIEDRRHRQQHIDHAREWVHAQLAEQLPMWCDIEEVVAVNAHRASREILQRAAAMGADLIAMGAQGTSGIELMLYGSNTHYVVRAATCPVLTVRAA